MTESPLYFKQMEIGPMANFIYLLGDPSRREAAVVDPAWDVDKILKVAEKDGYAVKHVLVSHGHPDHINGVEELMNRTNARLYMHVEETPWMRGWKSSIVTTQNGTEVAVGGVRVTCLHTPGHTPGSQCFLIGSRLLSGDTLFIESCGRTDLPGGDPEQLYQSLTGKIMKLDEGTMLYPGHNYSDLSSATLRDEKTRNPFLRCVSLDSFLEMIQPTLAW
jgi:glyoxylase-like metal-dependent hydrolase (beta-lactamase superfamily II)